MAEQQSIFIMRAFREMRHYIKQNQQFVTQAEMHLVSARVSEISVQMSNMADKALFGGRKGFKGRRSYYYGTCAE